LCRGGGIQELYSVAQKERDDSKIFGHGDVGGEMKPWEGRGLNGRKIRSR